jgi:CotH kinase protein
MSKYVFLVLVLMLNLPKAHTQNLYDLQTIRELRIQFNDVNWTKKLKALKEREPNRRIVCSVQLDGVTYDSVGVRYKGNSSYNNPSKKEQRKLPMNLKFDHVKPKQQLPNGVSTLKLSNAFRDPSFVREPLAYEIARKYMPASGSNFVRVYINGEYYGLYNSTESIDKAFIIKHFGSAGKAIFKCDPDDHSAIAQRPGCKLGKDASLIYLGAAVDCYKDLYEISGDVKHYADLVKLITMLDKTPEKIHEILNVDQTLWMLAFNNLFVSLDSYNGVLSHNYYLFLDSLGQFHPILWDMNLAFGGFRFNGNGLYSVKEMIEYAPLAEAENINRPLINKLLKSDYNRKVYYHHMRTMLEDWVETKRYFTSLSAMQTNIDRSVLDDSQKLYTYEAFRTNGKTTADAAKVEVIGINELMEGRAFYLRGLPEFKATVPTVIKQERSIVGDTATFVVKAKDATNLVIMHRAHKGQLFRAVRVVDKLIDTSSTDSDTSLFVHKMPLSEAKEYYYIIEGEQSIATFPAHASLEYLK